MKFSDGHALLLFAVIIFLAVTGIPWKEEEEMTLKLRDGKEEDEYNYRAIAYVTAPASENWRWIGTDGPGEDDAVSGVDTRYVTHINYAFGMIQAYQFEPDRPGCPLKEGRVVSREAYRNPEDGLYHYRAALHGWIEEMGAGVDGRKYVRALVRLKEKSPELKVLVSIGGWDSDGFCYMSASPEGRREFTESCIGLIREYGLDGIDLDWEYPANGGWGEIASCPHCEEDARILAREMRAAFDQAFPNEHKLLTIASGGSLPWADRETLPALDYINVMCYDNAPGQGGPQASLEMGRSGLERHLDLIGDTPENRRKLNYGVPFYNEGGPYLVPYYKDFDGYIDASPQIIADKMNWVKECRYGGGFYWAYSMDVFEQDREGKDARDVKILQRTLYETLHPGNGAEPANR